MRFRLLLWAFLALSPLASAASAESLRSRVSLGCESLLVRLQNAASKDTDAKLNRIIEFGKRGARDNSPARYSAMADHFERMRPEIAEKFRLEGLLHSEDEGSDAVRLDYAGLQVRFPLMTKIVPPGYKIYFAPNLDAMFSRMGTYATELTLLFPKLSLYDLPANDVYRSMIHEMVHGALETSRDKSGHYLWGLTYLPQGGRHSEKFRPYFESYSRRWIPEETLTYLTDYLLDLDSVCPNTDDAEEAKLYRTEIGLLVVLSFINGHNILHRELADGIKNLPETSSWVADVDEPARHRFIDGELEVYLRVRDTAAAKENAPSKQDLILTYQEEVRRLEPILDIFRRSGIEMNDLGMAELPQPEYLGDNAVKLCGHRDELWRALDTVAGTNLSRFRHVLD